MKQKDIALIIVVIAVSAVVSIVASKLLFNSSSSRQQKVEVVEAVSSDFNPPSTAYFNDDSIDPTQIITIGGNSNPDPFSGRR